MHPVIEAVLFLLRRAHESGNHPDGEALAHVRAIEEYEFDPPSTDPPVTRFMKLYPCGCQAGPGPADLPDYCPDHGNADETAECRTVEVPETPTAESTEPK